MGFGDAALLLSELDILSKALNALPVVRMLSYSKAGVHISISEYWSIGSLTARDHDPDKVHEEKVEPEVICLRSTVGEALMIVVK